MKYFQNIIETIGKKIGCPELIRLGSIPPRPGDPISLVADNVSGGIEPTFSHYYDRTIQTFEGAKTERVEDYAYAKGTEGRTANDINVQEHLSVFSDSYT